MGGSSSFYPPFQPTSHPLLRMRSFALRAVLSSSTERRSRWKAIGLCVHGVVHYVERPKLWCTWNGARHRKLQGPAYTGRCFSWRGLSFSVRGAVLDTEGFGAESLLVSYAMCDPCPYGA